ncbi:MAG: 4Fe-4S dicluster domain-containing protein [Desulfuromonadaceae bacterium]|nr:4Fe-4S dicluster domain-containing protein [Desulfuromonadaceae bacterium]MDD5105476.1 4Fe-4S dicluster domain-containing protein [Desulfuromonadaceae bacterium]
MVARFLEISNLKALLNLLRQRGPVHGPLRGADGVVRFASLTRGVLPDLSASRTMLPPKKYLLYPRERILTYTDHEGYRVPAEPGLPLILFGVHPCDLAGVNYLDKIFLGDDPDPLYSARRARLILVGSSCIPDRFCSCHASPSPLQALSDLFLHTVDGGFILTSESACGDELLARMQSVLEECTMDVPEDTRRFFGSTDAVPVIAEPEATGPEWQECADHCLGCGACSVCCPTCSCFDVLEFGGLDGCSAERVRQWDNCLFKGHAQVAGGLSFRKDRAERFRYRYWHKYGGFGPLRDVVSCVGCGRCRVACPTGIDLRQLAGQLDKGGK